MKITFLGASNTVTGSNYLISTDKYNFLIDCGLFQGSEEIEKLNHEDFSFDPSSIDFLVLSHAHIDHSGRIPKLVKKGFHGRIYSTKPTRDLCDIMLKDSGHIHEVEALLENKKRINAGLSKIEPLYTAADAELSMQYFNPIPYNEEIIISEDIRLRYKDAGHLFGSAIIELWIKDKGEEKKLVFSGDLGIKDRPLLRDPEYVDSADYLIIESTYGDRLHENSKERITKLVDIILETVKKGGNVVIPSFAIGRTQEIIYELNKFYDDREKINDFIKVPVYVDSPLAIAGTEVFKLNWEYFDDEAKEYLSKGDDPLDFKNLKLTPSVLESKKINLIKEPKVIISASGMCEAGRIQHHLKLNLPGYKNSVIFVGYQGEGTLGREIQEGAKTVKIFKDEVKVNARIYSIEGFSGHADMNDLLDWLDGFKDIPQNIFIVHGEKSSTVNFSKLINKRYNTNTFIPEIGETFDLE